MKKIITITIIIFITLGILLFPIKTTYKDGGTETYSAILYKYIKWNKNVLVNGETKEYINDRFVTFPNNFKDLEGYWKEEEKMLDSISIDKGLDRNQEIEDIKKYPEKETNKKDELIVHFDYPIIENSEIHKEIKNWGEKIIKDKKENSELKILELHFSFEIYKSNDLTSVVYFVNENYHLNKPIIYSKIFYIGKNGETLKEDDFFKNIDLSSLKEKIIEKLDEKNIDYFEEIDKNLENFLKKPKVYFDEEKVYFLFDLYQIAPYSQGNIEIKFYFEELKEFLNNEIFDKIKKETKVLEVDPNSGVSKTNENLEKQEKPKPSPKLEKKEDEKLELETKNSKKYIALTFDDGPSKKLTPKLLEILKKHNVKATFFVLGKNVQYFPETLKKTYDEGHEIGNHSWDHKNLKWLKGSKLEKQIKDTDNAIMKIIGEKPKTFRPPYGAFNEKTKKATGRTILMWNVDSMDWKNKDIEKNIESVEKDIKNGSIILFHDIHESSIDTIEPLIVKLKKEGYEFLGVSELLKIGQKGDISKKVCYGAFDCRK